MIASFLANGEREWTVNLDQFNPADATGGRLLFGRLQYILQVVFRANLYVSTSHGIENLCIFIREMPDKFERESLNLRVERVDF